PLETPRRASQVNTAADATTTTIATHTRRAGTSGTTKAAAHAVTASGTSRKSTSTEAASAAETVCGSPSEITAAGSDWRFMRGTDQASCPSTPAYERAVSGPSM